MHARSRAGFYILRGDSGFGTGMDSGSGTRDSGLGTRDSGLGIRDSGFGTRDLGLGTRDRLATKRWGLEGEAWELGIGSCVATSLGIGPWELTGERWD